LAVGVDRQVVQCGDVDCGPPTRQLNAKCTRAGAFYRQQDPPGHYIKPSAQAENVHSIIREHTVHIDTLSRIAIAVLRIAVAIVVAV